jgi:hypothetical protein
MEPIDDDEILYRRIPVSTNWYSPDTRILSPEAFSPHKDQDPTGLSISRGKYKSAEQAAQGRSGKTYFIAVLRAGDLKKAGINATPRPELADGKHDAAHAELPELNSGNRKDSKTLERQRTLVQLCLRIEGPYKTLAF